MAGGFFLFLNYYAGFSVASFVDSRYSCSPMATSEKVALSSALARLAISKNSLRWRSENASGIGRGCNGSESARAAREKSH